MCKKAPYSELSRTPIDLVVVYRVKEVYNSDLYVVSIQIINSETRAADIKHK